MGCGASFRSLDLLTKHMQETQHYKKVISHDQLSSWKYQDSHHQGGAGGLGAGGPKNHVNSVLSCKVCDKGFGSLKELSDHMVRANHFTGEMGMGGKGGALLRSPVGPNLSSASALARERKKALPVKKLLELERARQEVGGTSGSKAAANAQEILESGKLFCERCEERIPLDLFISHIQHCVGKSQSFSFLSSSSSAVVKQEHSSSSSPSPDSSKRGTELPEAASNASILGSLEQLVKGNFQPRRTTAEEHKTATRCSPPAGASAGQAGGHPSPPPLPVTSFNRFSIQSMVNAKVGEPVDSSSEAGGQEGERPLASPSCSSEAPSPQQLPASGPASPTSLPVGDRLKEDTENNHQMDGGVSSPTSTATPSSPVNGDRGVVSPLPAFMAKAASPLNGAKGGNPAAREGSPGGGPSFRLPIIKSEGPVLSGEKSNSSQHSSNSSNPLAALQMLCDTQKKMPKISSSGGSAGHRMSDGSGNGSNSSRGSPLSDPGAMMAFSWACNQAVVAADQSSVIKCPFCETPFISKGAYRHHLSKMHFTKEGAQQQTMAGGGGVNNTPPGTMIRTTPSPSDTKDEEENSLQSKYQKYAQLGRQLSCNQK
jgi:uncharacterized C2H2 Zn-finger protein